MVEVQGEERLEDVMLPITKGRGGKEGIMTMVIITTLLHMGEVGLVEEDQLILNPNHTRWIPIQVVVAQEEMSGGGGDGEEENKSSHAEKLRNSQTSSEHTFQP